MAAIDVLTKMPSIASQPALHCNLEHDAWERVPDEQHKARSVRVTVGFTVDQPP